MNTADRSERDEIIDRVFERVTADMAELLSRPPTEDEIAHDVAALERAERLQRLPKQAHPPENGHRE